MIFSTLFFYIFISSAVFIYGIGLKKVIVISKNLNNLWILALKTLICTLLSLTICWLLTTVFLVPFELTEVYPVFCILVSLMISYAVQMLIEYLWKVDTSEFSLTFLIIILAINEAASLFDAILIALACVLSFYCIMPILYAIRVRIKLAQPHIDYKSGALVFLSIAFILFILFVWNISWLNFEVQ